MENSLRSHVTYTSILIITKIILVSLTALYFNQLAAIIIISLGVVYLFSWFIISLSSKNKFDKYLTKMRTLMIVFILFQAPNFFKIDLNPKGTIKKEKYSYDTYWLYSYLKRREFEITDQKVFETQIRKEMKDSESKIKIANMSLSIGLLLTLTAYVYSRNVEHPSDFILGIFIILVSIFLFGFLHNLFMRILVKRNHTQINKAFDENDYDLALRYAIIYLGMTKGRLYKTGNTQYLKSVESNYLY